jgi:mersacidin/lichenicidin family type 2 lantibiotic
MPEEVYAAKDVILRAWKDEKFRNSLSSEERALIPPAPESTTELSDSELEVAAGAATPGVLIAIKTGSAIFGKAAAGSAGTAVGGGLGLKAVGVLD